ncbi:MAG: GNAT family N-acetyltransferase [Crocinitomicaceae bacterium]|nr:GNAT family N-acetyltransferase [Crocinitomicaceae bacterium]
MNFHIETERFILREFRETDVDDLFEMDSDPEVHRYLGNQPLKSKDQVFEYIGAVQQQYKDFGIGRWIVEDMKTKECLGWSGLKYETSHIDQSKYYDLGYRLKRKHWGKGIATETSEAALDFGFHCLHIKKICGVAHVDNIASNHVLQKLGFTQTKDFLYEQEPCHWYELDRKF